MPTALARKVFTALDQERFAAATGDYNPMHMDAVAARRTQAGAPVVHGIHTLLWCLDTLADQHSGVPPIRTVRVDFDKMLYVGEEAEARIINPEARPIRIEVVAGGVVVTRIAVGFSEPSKPTHFSPDPVADYDVLQPTRPLDITLEQMTKSAGRVALASPAEDFAFKFPHISALWGASRTAALGCSTRLVGMICPGLHSIFGGLVLSMCEPDPSIQGLEFAVTTADDRFRFVRMNIRGGGLIGTVATFARQPPTPQAGMDAAASHVSKQEFLGSTALIIGGSRGLGEVVAKLLASGGAHVVITYATGRDDAIRLQGEIEDHGGLCTVMAYDARLPVDPQLASMNLDVDSLYYFATPTIARRKSEIFVAANLNDFLAFYVDGFYDLCKFLQARRPIGISAFYPSSVFVEDRPAGMTEYSMAKAAGEMLCADINALNEAVVITVSRLPRLPTDQTAALQPFEMDNPFDIILPYVRAVHNKRFVMEVA